MTLEAFYASPLQHPGLSWLACGLALPFVLKVRDVATRRVLLLFWVTTALDAWLSGPLSPLPAGTLLTRNVIIGLVMWGDARLFVLAERQRSPTGWRGAFLRGLGFALIVPVVQGLLIHTWRDFFADERRIYLAWELSFVALGLTLLFTRYRGSPLLRFFLVQYALWVVSDVLLLGGHPWAFALRVVPNVLYYGGFLAFAAWLSSEHARPAPTPHPGWVNAT